MGNVPAIRHGDTSAAGPLEAAVSNKMFGWSATDEQRGIFGYGFFEQVMHTLEQAVCEREQTHASRYRRSRSRRSD